MLPVGSALMAAIFVFARRKTDYEALDPTFETTFPHSGNSRKTADFTPTADI